MITIVENKKNYSLRCVLEVPLHAKELLAHRPSSTVGHVLTERLKLAFQKDIKDFLKHGGEQIGALPKPIDVSKPVGSKD